MNPRGTVVISLVSGLTSGKSLRQTDAEYFSTRKALVQVS